MGLPRCRGKSPELPRRGQPLDPHSPFTSRLVGVNDAAIARLLVHLLEGRLDLLARMAVKSWSPKSVVVLLIYTKRVPPRPRRPKEFDEEAFLTGIWQCSTWSPKMQLLFRSNCIFGLFLPEMFVFPFCFSGHLH